MTNVTDLTDRLERTERLEERAGVTFSACSAFLSPDGDGVSTLRVMGEMHARSGDLLPKSTSSGYLTVIAVAYDADGRVVGRGSEGFDRDTFFGLEVFEVSIYTLSDAPALVRLLAK